MESTLMRQKRRIPTGLFDKHGKFIKEGDILLEYYNDVYGKVPVVVHWDPDKGAWVSYGELESGSSHISVNGEHFKNCEIIGNIDETPEKFYPAKKRKK